MYSDYRFVRLADTWDYLQGVQILLRADRLGSIYVSSGGFIFNQRKEIRNGTAVIRERT